MKKVITIISVLLFVNTLISQEFSYESHLDKISQKGFYKTELQEDIVSKLNKNFNDIRLIDARGVEVPFCMRKESFSITKRAFREYQIKEKIKWKNGATVLVVENINKEMINNIQLQIKNFDVRKRLELSGSDDYDNWYAIKENYVFRSANGLKTTSELKSLNFPYTDYNYYRIIIYDCFSLPINVLKIGYFDTYKELGKYKKLETPELSRIDSTETKKTYIKVSFKEVPYFDKLTLRVSKPTYYYRNAKLCLKHIDKKGRAYFEVKNSFILSSNDALTFYCNEFNSKEFYLVIENEDNPPLENVRLEAFQLKRSIVTYLEGGDNYRLVFGNDKLKQAPNYDITHFKNKIGEDIPALLTGKIVPINHRIEKKELSSGWWLWGAITIVATLLGYMSFKMIKEMDGTS